MADSIEFDQLLDDVIREVDARTAARQQAAADELERRMVAWLDAPLEGCSEFRATLASNAPPRKRVRKR